MGQERRDGHRASLADQQWVLSPNLNQTRAKINNENKGGVHCEGVGLRVFHGGGVGWDSHQPVATCLVVKWSAQDSLALFSPTVMLMYKSKSDTQETVFEAANLTQ